MLFRSEVNGFGIIKIQELPRDLVSGYQGQIDSVFCKTGDLVTPDQRLMTICQSGEKACQEIVSPFAGEITGVEVKEGSSVQPGTPVLKITKNITQLTTAPEVIFFVATGEIEKIQKGMTANWQVAKRSIPAEFLSGTITFIAGYPASKSEIQKYFPDEDLSLRLKKDDLYEVRALLLVDNAAKLQADKAKLLLLNGLSCQVAITVDRQSPVKFLFK